MTLKELRDRVKKLIGQTQSTQYDDSIDDSINFWNQKAHIIIYEKEGFWVSGEKEYAIDLVAGSSAYSVPQDLHLVTRIEVKSSTDGSFAKYEPFNEREVPFTINESLLNHVYRIQNRNIILYPTPDSNVTGGIFVLGKAYPDALENDTDDLNVGIPHSDFIIFGACVDYFMPKDANKTTQYQNYLSLAESKLGKYSGKLKLAKLNVAYVSGK